MRSPADRAVRYGAPILLVIVSVLFAAADTAQLGNDVQVAGTAVGLIWLLVVVGRDMGMGIGSGHPPRVPDPPPERPAGATGAGGGDNERQPPASSA